MWITRPQNGSMTSDCNKTSSRSHSSLRSTATSHSRMSNLASKISPRWGKTSTVAALGIWLAATLDLRQKASKAVSTTQASDERLFTPLGRPYSYVLYDKVLHHLMLSNH